MPLIRVEVSKTMAGYKYGESGKVYKYPKNDRDARQKAKLKALKQGRAIEASENK